MRHVHCRRQGGRLLSCALQQAILLGPLGLQIQGGVDGLDPGSGQRRLLRDRDTGAVAQPGTRDSAPSLTLPVSPATHLTGDLLAKGAKHRIFEIVLFPSQTPAPVRPRFDEIGGGAYHMLIINQCCTMAPYPYYQPPAHSPSRQALVLLLKVRRPELLFGELVRHLGQVGAMHLGPLREDLERKAGHTDR